MEISKTSDVRVSKIQQLDPPSDFLKTLPISKEISEVVVKGRQDIERIIDLQDRRLLMIVGPCSIHDEEAGLDYAKRLVNLAQKVEDQILVVMRVYFEKPRTTVGWKGLINDPNLDGSFDITQGFEQPGYYLLLYYQDIELGLGWSLWSTYIDPEDASMETVFSDLIDDVLIVKNQYGNVYWPAFDLNNIGNLAIGQGYQVKMNTDNILSLSGDLIPSDYEIPLDSGWGIVGYLLQNCNNAVDMMMDLVNDNILVILKDEYGDVYWPEFDLNSIGNMCPGEGYQIKTTGTVDFSYPSGGRFGFSDFTVVGKTVHYDSALNTGNNMIIGLPTTAWKVMPSIGDEIAAYDELDRLIGSTVFTDDNIALTVWGDDLTTDSKDGLSIGEKVTLKLWSPDMNTEETLIVTKWDAGSDAYTIDGISIASNIILSGDVSADTYKLYQNVPNPFNGTTTIKFYVPENTEVTIGVYNMLGEYVAKVTNDIFNSGKHEVMFNSGELGQGTYFVRMTTEGFTATKSMNIVK